MIENCNIITILKNAYGKDSYAEKQYSYNENKEKTVYDVSYFMGSNVNSEEYTAKGNIKYAMYCSVGEDKFDELIIVIGQNPSKSYKSGIDGTNLNILKTLLAQSPAIKQYLMLNTFPIIDPNGANSPSEACVHENVQYMKKLFKKFEEGKIKIKIVYAFGCKLPVYKPFVKELNRIVIEMKIETFAFEYSNGLQAHMSQQSCNSQSRNNRSEFILARYCVNECNNDDFAIYGYKKCE